MNKLDVDLAVNESIVHIFPDFHLLNPVVDYKGKTSDKEFAKVMDRVEDTLRGREDSNKLRKKVFNLTVEIVQNMYHHTEKFTKMVNDYDSVVFILGKVNEKYHIFAGNYIISEKIHILKDRLDLCNSLSMEELRDMYRDRLRHGKFSAKGGGGLGIMDIIRKSGEKINYNFSKVDDEFSFFAYQIKVSK